jgi:Tol biopolymer transport system component
LDDRNDFPTTWADNATVVFTSDRLGTSDIYRQSIDSEAAEMLVGGPGRQTGARRTPDGTGILFVSTIEAGPELVVRRVPLGGGVPVDVVKCRNYEFLHCSQSRCILVEREGDAQIVYELDPVKGRGKKLAELHWTDTDPVISPDGRQIAYRSYSNPVADASQLKVMTLEDAGVVTLDLPGLPSVSSLDWAPDGKGFYFVHAQRPDSPAAGTTLYYVPLRGKPVPIYSASEAAPQWAIPSPDGRRLAIHTRTHKRNVWTLEGF